MIELICEKLTQWNTGRYVQVNFNFGGTPWTY